MRKVQPAKLFFVLAASGVFVTWCNSNRAYPVQDDKGGKNLAEARFFGVSTCQDCHIPSFKEGKIDIKLILQTEYRTWKTQDRHAQAYAVLEGPRGKQMAELLKSDVTDAPMCLSCHATSFLSKRGGKGFKLAEGVSCDGCHGPAEYWLTDHVYDEKWRTMSPHDKEQLGLFNVRDPIKRAELCLSCHVGSAAEGKVVTHSMYAAGHPPLPSFELATFSQNLPKHWWDLKDVPYFAQANEKIKKQYDFELSEFQHTRLVVAGSIVGLRRAMELLANRADHAVIAEKPDARSSWPPPWLRPHLRFDPNTRWPELKIGEKFGLPFPKDDDLKTTVAERYPEFMMAQADCYACHHDLKRPGWRQKRAYPGKPGRPQFQPWPVALAKIAVRPADQKELFSLLSQLHEVFAAQPFGEPSVVSSSAQKIVDFLKKQSQEPSKLNREIAQGYLRTLTALAEDDYPDYDSARQIAGAFQAIFWDAWNKQHRHQAEVKSIFRDINDMLNVTLCSKVTAKSSQARYKMMEPYYGQSMDAILKNSTDVEKKNGEGFLKGLHKINDGELKDALDCIANYDPVFFKKRLRELSRLVAD
jgi:hypothetical protein